MPLSPLAFILVMANDYASTTLGRERKAMTGTRNGDADAASAAKESTSCLLRVRGLVQGVGFRHSLHREATRAGLAGWVRNRHDGSVEAFLQGPPAALGELVDWAHSGPPAARVDSVELAAAPADPEIDGFEQRPTA